MSFSLDMTRKNWAFVKRYSSHCGRGITPTEYALCVISYGWVATLTGSQTAEWTNNPLSLRKV